MEVTDLPALNATLNGVSAVLLCVGYGLIRGGRKAAHRWVMSAAFGCSVLFLTSYLIYHAQAGSVPFEGTGAIRTFYFGVLLSHIVLAALVPFLALVTLFRAVRGDFERHRRIARFTLPIWLYVSVTGVMVYWMLYQLDLS
jgi:uncharacterized membrane protein YozB (DUF420 family)